MRAARRCSRSRAPAEVLVPEIADQTFRGVVARNASALQAGTRTLLVEIDVDNADGALFPGHYCTVRLHVPRPQPVVIVPAQAIIFDRNGLSAAVYRDGAVQLRSLDVVIDNGAQIEVRGGLEPGDRIILSPPVNVEKRHAGASERRRQPQGEPGLEYRNACAGR